MTAPAATNIKLNLGCRTRSKVGWLNLDCDPHPGVDFVGDAGDLSRFADGSIEAIYASHILEHFPHPETPRVLKEWARVLEPGGKLYVAVPDFERCVELYTQVGLNEWIVRFLMGDQEYKTAYHYNLFDEGRLSRKLADAGFSDSFRVEEFEDAEEGECSNLVSTHDMERVSLNMVAIR
jgi:predicted SAM-dependent methyltransferase